ncbi:TPA: hypothetical protein NKS89_000354 [Vibrio parahaemolyticus]|uniref:hypothetical protein n=1 Tax=Vibrio parahaemolyticus TaxID=670 RepID=UPI0007A08AE9|nr:hypothetical protein [Vibrio parahaemolyticus]ELJ8766201.1 hypothetical protein [Vibrio parahaemolyticus]KYX34770.1 hypothetical protein AU388_14270 [Vibrio parahaemolyticus]MBO1670603.1 hypothetical protein [Vibrio parahaemolyticus]HCE3466343.1 hypothetical protein [Vibrio parahaemolyticus]HCE4913588.1 hypothetical protein [Vibrio parahaemolyticus]
MSFKPKKAHNWNGKSLKGDYRVTVKIDGVRLTRNEQGGIVSRSNKPLYNLPPIPEHIQDAEIFLGDWDSTISAVRTHEGDTVPYSAIYELRPNLDPRLDLGIVSDPSAAYIQEQLEASLGCGYEGLVLERLKDGRWIKVKNKETYDVLVTGFQAGTGKHEGRMGALITAYGKVGTGFTDTQRQEWQDLHDQGLAIGMLIEVECMEVTKDGKFRHPRFVRPRVDKLEETPPRKPE